MSATSETTKAQNIDAAELARRVKARREAEKMSLREAGEALDMSAATLSRVETGRHLPERDRLLRLAAWAGMPLDPASRAARNRTVHGEHASTVEAVELHLRADEKLDPDDAEILVQLVKTAYDQMSRRK